MKLWGKCGCEIHDTTDHLSYKGAIIADQDICTRIGMMINRNG